jgi:hypothetical protein
MNNLTKNVFSSSIGWSCDCWHPNGSHFPLHLMELLPCHSMGLRQPLCVKLSALVLMCACNDAEHAVW